MPPDPPPPVPPTSQRADATRNRALILDAATVLLATDPDATMRAMAEAAGVTRMTVYRHFPSREAVLGAIAGRAADGAEPLLSRATHGEETLADAVALLAGFVIDAGRRHPALAVPATVDAFAREVDAEAAFAPFLEARRARGEVRGDVPVRWQASAVRGLMVSALHELADGELEPALLREALADGLLAVLRVP